MGVWHSIPSFLSPVAVHIGPVAIHWYSVLWLCAFVVVVALVRLRVHRAEGQYTWALIEDGALWAFLGAIVGGRIGYVLLYDFAYYSTHPLAIVSPYDLAAGVWTGIYGMSYHGGLVGVAVGIWWVARQHRVDFVRLMDFLVPAIPAGYFFGRLGNFFNQELVGRVTTAPVGMFFQGDTVLRHPSQLYEAITEGVILFVILWLLRNRVRTRGMLTVLYIALYSIARFVCEFFREPDAHIGIVWYGLTMGQILSAGMLSCAMIFMGSMLWHADFMHIKKKYGILKKL